MPAVSALREPAKAPNVTVKPIGEPKAESNVVNNCTKAGTGDKVSGAIHVTIPKYTMAVFTCTSDADYFQSVTINPGKGLNEGKELAITSFRGNGRDGTPMKQHPGGMHYMQVPWQSEDRDVKLSFYYSQKSGEQAEWEAPIVEGPRRERHNGIDLINFGSEDSTNDSYNDTSLTIWLFPTGKTNQS